MNAVANSTSDFISDDAVGSDSDSNAEELPDYYEPISTIAGSDEDEEFSDQNSDGDAGESNVFHSLPNGYARCVENGVSSLDLSDGDGSSDNEVEEERMREVSESERAIERAFREDEMRRLAPLPPENASRIMEAMRGVSFGGPAPDWAGRVSDDQWLNQIQRLRRPTSAAIQE